MSIAIENVDIHGWKAAIRGARNPMNSWDKSDTKIIMGKNDHKLLMNLCKGGSEESKWRRFVHVSMDIIAPLYWWKEFETYKVGTACNSCSTMHKIQAKKFTLEDFSCDHLGYIDWDKEHDDREYYETAIDGDGGPYYPIDLLTDIIAVLNHNREKFLETGDKKFWWQMIQLLPTSYNQRRTIDLNYEVLAKQYRERKNHKLDEWREYCEWIKTLPYSELITMEEI